MILSDVTIKRMVQQKMLHISDFNEDQLQGTSYDVGLRGEFFRMHKDAVMTFDPVTGKPDDYAFYEGCVAPEGLIQLEPGERILGCTQEAIGSLVPDVVPIMKAKSTAARFGIHVCDDAGHGDPGYCVPWAMEITNRSPNTILIPVGVSIAQIIFHRVDRPVAQMYGQQIGQYQRGSNPEELMKDWDITKIIPQRLKVYK